MIKTGYIYKIYDNTNGNVYYGSTKENYLSSRIANHRNHYKRYLEGKGNFVKSFDILKNNDYSYSVVEKIEYNEKYELHQRERFYIENNECINKYIPNRTSKEFYHDNKDKIKQYREQNKDKIKQQIKEYYEKNKEQKKEYYEKNKDKIKEYKEQYREQNKDKLKEQRQQKTNCPHCNKEMSKASISRHIKNKH